MYGELNFNPSLFVAQMKYIVLPLAVGTFVALCIVGTYFQIKEKKVKKK